MRGIRVINRDYTRSYTITKIKRITLENNFENNLKLKETYQFHCEVEMKEFLKNGK